VTANINENIARVHVFAKLRSQKVWLPICVLLV